MTGGCENDNFRTHGNLAADIPSGVYHTAVSLESGTVFYEAKAGPYLPLAETEIVTWAPDDDEPAVQEFLERLRELFDCMVMRILAVAIILSLICSGEPSRAAFLRDAALQRDWHPGAGVFADRTMPYRTLNIYKEPGISRMGMLKSVKCPDTVWSAGKAPPLIVSARKGDWLRVSYDDAGREAWMDPQRRGAFQSWEQFLKRQTGRMLPGVPAVLSAASAARQTAPGPMTARQMFKVVKLENAWGMVMTDQTRSAGCAGVMMTVGSWSRRDGAG